MLARFYQSPEKRYATSFIIPLTLSDLVPAMFGQPEIEGTFWGILYKGPLVHQTGITFRFLGWGDGALAIRVAGETVLVVSPGGWLEDSWGRWQSSSADSKKYWMGNGQAAVSDWITLEPGVALDMEVLMVEGGGRGCLMIAVEEEGVEYERRKFGNGSVFPAFKTGTMPRDMLDVIYRDLVAGEISLTNGPVFNDYGGVNKGESPTIKEAASPEALLPEPEPAEPAMRIWNSMDGKNMEAEFVIRIGNEVILKTPKGKQKKLPFAQLSAEDRKYVELAKPPVFKIEFSAKTERLFSIAKTTEKTPLAFNYSPKVGLKQTSAGVYNHEVFIEFFAIGQEIYGNRYVLLDHQTSSFTPNMENRQSHEIKGRLIQIPDFTLDGQHRGVGSYGYVVWITDSRGELIQHKESNAWLYENLERLKQLPVGSYMDKSGNRVFPTGPKRTAY